MRLAKISAGVILAIGMEYGVADVGAGLSHLVGSPGFKKGVNTELIFTKVDDAGVCILDESDERKKEDMFPGRKQITLLKQRGFDHIRLPLEYAYLFKYRDDAAPIYQALREDVATELLKYINGVNKLGMGVIVDLHVARYACGEEFGGIYSQFLEKRADEGEEAVEQRRGWFKKSWIELAKFIHSRNTNPDMVLLEPMNEPVFMESPQEWKDFQLELVKEIRKHAPNHRVVMTGSYWSNIDALVGMKEGNEDRGPFPVIEPLTDSNTKELDSKVVYNFHLYDPFVFTHQGASWDEPYDILNKVPFLPNSAGMSRIFRVIDEKIKSAENDNQREMYQRLKREAIQYLAEFGSAGNDPIQARLQLVIRWAEWYGVPRRQLIATEWGAFPDKADYSSYMKYTSYVSDRLRRNGIGSTWYFGNSWAPADWPADTGANSDFPWNAYRFDIQKVLGLDLPVLHTRP